MLDEKYLELIQAGIDGELPEQHRAELSRYLLANPEARAARDQLQRLCTLLGKVPAADPPPDLRASILGAIRLPAGSGAPVGRRYVRWFSGTMRFAAVFVAGLVVGITAMQLGRDSRSRLDLSQVAGTMASQDQVVDSTPVDTVTVSLEQVSGSVRLFRSPTMRVVEFDLTARQPVEVVVDHDGEQARFSGFSQPGSGGGQRYALVLDGPGQAGSTVGLKFFASGTLIREDALAVPASR